MGIKLGQKLIDNIRGKKNKVAIIVDPLDAVLADHREKLKNKGFLFENNYLISPNKIKMNHSFGLEYIAWEVFFNGDYEIFDNKESILIDVGMNFATTTLYFAQQEKIKHVYSFEPFIPTYDGAVKNIKLNPTLEDKITTYPYGLSDKDCEIEILYNKDLAGAMSISHDRFTGENPDFDKEDAHYEKAQIKDSAEMIAPILEQHSNQRIILKVDTEGAEFDIFKSLDENGLLNKIDIVLMEYHFKSPKELEERLNNNGFVVFYKGGFNPNEKVGMLFAVRASK